MKQSSPKSSKKPKFKGVIFMLVVILIYVVLFFFQKQMVFDSLKHFLKNTLMIIPIFAIVILLTALLNYFYPKEKIAKLFKEKSKFRTYMMSLVAGIVSHGPIIAWFPFLKDVSDNGVSKGNLVTFIYGRGVKLTLLPVMIGFFGAKYTFVFIFYLALGALVQGFVYDRFVKK